MSSTQDPFHEWLSLSSGGDLEFKKAVHTILEAISQTPQLSPHLIIKGGILLALNYQSPRFTKDIDFSASLSSDPESIDTLVAQINSALQLASLQLDYGLACLCQSRKVEPANQPHAQFPSLKLKIGYAEKGSKKHKRLLNKNSPDTVSIDISFNEEILNQEAMPLGENSSIQAYGISDLIAEKLRSLLQQPSRNRHRRQDIYDLCHLLNLQQKNIDSQAILASLLAKSHSRKIYPTPDSISDPEVRRRAQKEYPSLANELNDPLPDFDLSYQQVEAFYRSLPWKTTNSTHDKIDS